MQKPNKSFCNRLTVLSVEICHLNKEKTLKCLLWYSVHIINTPIERTRQIEIITDSNGTQRRSF